VTQGDLTVVATEAAHIFPQSTNSDISGENENSSKVRIAIPITCSSQSKIFLARIRRVRLGCYGALRPNPRDGRTQRI
jgi:hypothetical protein